MKVWHNGELKTVEQMHADQTPYEVYRDACLRLDFSGSPATNDRLRKRWPTLADCNSAMTDAYRRMTADERAYEDDLAQRDLDLIALAL